MSKSRSADDVEICRNAVLKHPALIAETISINSHVSFQLHNATESHPAHIQHVQQIIPLPYNHVAIH